MIQIKYDKIGIQSICGKATAGEIQKKGLIKASIDNQ